MVHYYNTAELMHDLEVRVGNYLINEEFNLEL